jgi:signal transduction histidine kinase/CheY-like chemotaxis protein
VSEPSHSTAHVPPTAPIERLVEADLLRRAYEDARGGIITTLFVGSLFACVIAFGYSIWTALLWLLLLSVVSVFRFWHLRHFLQTPPDRRHYESDLQRFTFGVTLSGLFFGAMPWIAFHTDNGFLLSVVLMGSIGMASGGTRTLTPLPRANNLYILCILVPLTVRYVTMWNGPALGMAVIVVCYTSYLILSSGHHYRTLRHSIRLDFENELLIRNLTEAKTKAEAASQAKSNFLATISHEIRTPMNGILGMLQALRSSPLNQEQHQQAEIAAHSADNLLRVINDILDFSKIESGKMEIENHPVDLPTCIEEALDLFSLSAASKKLELAYCINEGVPDWIVSDITRLRQILANLINNAVKFTSAGSVSIEVQSIRPGSESGAEPGALRLQFTVRDTGIGIPADRVDRLFKPFSQVDSSTTRKYGGTGLGLAICQRLSALMGGDIRVESEAGRGSAFIFTIQTSPAPVPPESVLPTLPESFRGRPVLCIEDHAVTQRRLVRLIRDLGSRPVPVSSVNEAVQLLVRSEAPAAVVLDLPMIEASEGRVLRDHITSLQIPTVLLLPLGQTSVSAFGERRLFSTAAKPLKTQSLIRALRALGQSLPRKDLPPASVIPENRLLAQDYPLDVLVVEDNPVNQKVAIRFLERLGYRSTTADNGVQAIIALESREFDLVFMDLQMPEMDGFEASRQIRQRFALTRQPKIVALTANALQGDRELCLAAGMDDYITKPVKMTDIAAVIQKQFAKAAPQET